MKKILNISNIYLLLFLIQQMQGLLYEGGGMLSQAIIGLMSIYSFGVAIYAFTLSDKPRYFTGLNLLIALFSIYGIIHIFTTSTDYVWALDKEVSSYRYLLYIYLSLLPIYVFYVSTVRGEFDQKKIQRWAILFLLFSFVNFVKQYLLSLDSIDGEGFTNNMGYLFVGMIPLLVFFNNKQYTQYLLLTICMIMVILSMKRGAVLVASFSLIPFVFYLWKYSTGSKRLVISLMIIAFVLGGVYFLQYMIISNDYFLQRIEDTIEGDSSLRNEIYENLWIYFTDHASLGERLLGGGANHTLEVAENYAHNDWLEILINQGVLGIIVYIVYWFNFIRTIRDCGKIEELNLAKTGLTICLVASMLMTLYSMSYGDLPFGLTMAIGICLGQITLYNSGQTTIHA